MFVAAHDPVPEPQPVAPPPVAPEPEQIAEILEPTPPTIDPVPVEPVAETPAPRVFIVPEVEKSDVIVVGPAETGPAKAGWWKKREG